MTYSFCVARWTDKRSIHPQEVNKQWMKRIPESSKKLLTRAGLRLPFRSPSSLVLQHSVLWTVEGPRVSQSSLEPCPCAFSIWSGLLPILSPENSPFKALKSHLYQNLPMPTSITSADPPHPTGPGGLSVMTEMSLICAVHYGGHRPHVAMKCL